MKPKYYVARCVEICERDTDGDDIVHAVCGAASSSRSNQYTRLGFKTNAAMAERIVALLNEDEARRATLGEGGSHE